MQTKEIATSEVKRRIPRKRSRVQIVKIIVDGVEVDGKECTVCGVEKELEKFTNNPRGVGGKYSKCYECCNIFGEKRSRKSLVVNIDSILKKRCSMCSQYLSLGNFYPNKKRTLEKGSYCRECAKVPLQKYRLNNRKKITERGRAYVVKNSKAVRAYEKKRYERRRNDPSELTAMRERCRKYYQRNKKQAFNYSLKRKTRKYRLATVWSEVEREHVLDVFQNKCVFTEEIEKLHLDHVIPLSWGHGGAYVGNIVPIQSVLNLSKNDNHVYLWFEDNFQRHNLSLSKFESMVNMLAYQNGLTTSEFRSYVDWCYDNPRTIDEIKRDNDRYGYVVSSLELWRAATGMQFPIRIDFDKKPPVARRKKPDRAKLTEVSE